MLRVDIRQIRSGPVETVGTVPAADPLFEGLEVALAGPLEVTGTLEKLHGLVAKGILTQQEFDAKKADLMSKI